MKTLSSRVKISTVEQKRTPRQRRKSHSDHKRKQNQENPVKYQKTTQQKNIASPLKEYTNKYKPKPETVTPSKPAKNKAAIPKPSDSVLATLPTKHSPQPSSDVLPFF